MHLDGHLLQTHSWVFSPSSAWNRAFSIINQFNEFLFSDNVCPPILELKRKSLLCGVLARHTFSVPAITTERPHWLMREIQVLPLCRGEYHTLQRHSVLGQNTLPTSLSPHGLPQMPASQFLPLTHIASITMDRKFQSVRFLSLCPEYQNQGISGLGCPVEKYHSRLIQVSS